VKAGAVVAGIYPPSLGYSGMMLQNRALLWLAPWVPGVVGWMLDTALGRAARNEDPEVFYKTLLDDVKGGSMPDIDKRTLGLVMAHPVMRRLLVEPMRDSLTGLAGTKGAAWEARLYGSDWGFGLEEVEGEKLTVWHGTLDVNAPCAMADKATKIMQCEYRRIEGCAHFSASLCCVPDAIAKLIEDMNK
jgi:hypothetical protein